MCALWDTDQCFGCCFCWAMTTPSPSVRELKKQRRICKNVSHVTQEMDTLLSRVYRLINPGALRPAAFAKKAIEQGSEMALNGCLCALHVEPLYLVNQPPHSREKRSEE